MATHNQGNCDADDQNYIGSDSINMKSSRFEC